MSRAIAAFEPCGCTAWIEVLGYGVDAGAYRTAADHAKRGFVIDHVDVEKWKARGLWCNQHPDGPPWWKTHGGNGKRPAEFEQAGLES